MTIFSEWDAGVLTDFQALHSLASDLGELEDTLSPLLRQRDELRAQISRVVAHAGGRADVPGFGQLMLTQPSITRSFDTEGLNELCLRLIQDGYAPIAEQIARLRKESSRAGSLRITREKDSNNGKL